ncbi:hypothetical protein PR202_ga19530 [Eleusine coracana subsp. coracana]|uniref:GATA-type domain-containing protein n=1 Tax=Eleusine coracana subsp. coracana TaxID=191504 RepID=A0AAV5CUC1_ELECO|nr:hypothetical protein PR202_ga19530 [Eleusine coracana subsp. coracana]
MKSGGFLAEETAEEVAAASLVEREGFSVEDLLDLEEFGEPEKDAVKTEDAPPPPPSAAAGEETETEKKPSVDWQPSSIVKYEMPLPPPPPEMVDLPAHDVEEELEWVSRIMDDSLSELPPAPVAVVPSQVAYRRPPPPHHLLPRRPYDGAYRALPLTTPTICALSTEALVPVKARRSKRSRSSAWSLSGTPLFSDSTSSSSTTTTSSSSCSSAASLSPFFLPLDFDGYHHQHHYFLTPPPPLKKKKAKHGGNNGGKPKKRGRKPKKHVPHLTGAAAASAAASQQASAAQGERRCSHCGVQKTPQWRAGPEGAKTLCNACGVRYKSGRLLPEYRPACSPTFVSSIHSNSHRKVLEMRRKKEALIVHTAAPPVASF